MFRFLSTVTGTFEPAVRFWHYYLFGLRPSCVFEVKLKTLRFGDGGVQDAFAHMAHVGYLKTRDDPVPETYLILFQTRTDGPSDIAWHCSIALYSC